VSEGAGRTALSWQRSQLAVALVAAFVAVAALRLRVPAVAVAAGAVALAGVLSAVVPRPRAPGPSTRSWLLRLAATTAAVGLLGAALGVVEVLGRLV